MGSSRRKISRKEGSGSVKVWNDFHDRKYESESSQDTLNLIDGQLLQDALQESVVCRDCKSGELQLLEERNTRSGQRQVWLLQCKRVDCKSHKNLTRLHTSPKNS